MKPFHFSHNVESPTEHFQERFFQMLPGFLSWAILIGFITLSYLKPLNAALLIIAFDLYWLFRIFYLTVFMTLAYGVLAVEKETDWIERCRLLEQGSRGLEILRKRFASPKKRLKMGEWFALKNQERELKKVVAAGMEMPSFESITHVVIIAAAKELREVVEPAIKALTQSQFPTKRILPILAVEARTGPKQTEMAEALQKKYGDFFFDFLVSVHPDGVPGEARVKGANVTHAAREAARFFQERKIDFKNVVLSCFDADTVAPPEYFAALTYHFMRHPDRLRASFQPIPVYHNNIWEAPGFARVLEMGSSFFQLAEATNPEKLVTFSSHSMSFKALVEIAYCPVDMI